MIKLRDIRGVGPSIEKKLVSYFGSENLVLNALRGSRIAEISSIDGIGERFALSLCRNLHYQETGEQIQDFLKTEDTILIYNRIIDLVSKFGNTFYSRSKLYLYFPLPITALNKIKNRQEITRLGQELFTIVQGSKNALVEYDSYLRQLLPLKEHSESIDTASRAVATTDKGIYNELLSNIIGKYCEILFIEDYEKINDTLAGLDEIIWIGSDYILDDEFPNIITVSESQRHEVNRILPEKSLIFFAQNKNTLITISKLALHLREIPSEKLKDFIGDLDLNMLVNMGKELTNLEETGEPSSRLNKDFSRLLKVETTFEMVLEEVLLKLNDELEKKLQDTTIHLEGEKILALLKGFSTEGQGYSTSSSREDLREYLDDELFLAVEEIINRAEIELAAKLNLSDEETGYLNGVFPRELKFPIDPQDDIKNRFIEFIRKKRSSKAFELKVDLAQKLKGYERVAIEGLNCMLELDYLLMIGKFAGTYKLSLPSFLEGRGTGLFFKEGKNLFLAHQELRGQIKLDPVSYAIGEIGKITDGVDGERIVLLSGANSGGKTTLLVAIAVIVILSQMGLPVPCYEAKIGGFKELHYYRKSTGHMNAGAFESTLRTLSQMIMSPNSRLVLADEMESISEPGASARVIAAFLDLLGRSPDSVGIFVTHLAQEISKYTKEGLRIDGIEAKGLSENLDLIVDRTPKYYKYAKSTPELIVQRLQHISKGAEKEIYTYILETFDS
ncbi:MAG: MutS-related protein [Candidatus Hodarchaeales archaeon]